MHQFKKWLRVMALLAGMLLVVGAPALAAKSKKAAPAIPANPQATSAVPGQPNISGIWTVREFVISNRPSAERRMKTIDGENPPMLPWAQALYDERARLSDVGTPWSGPPGRCLPNGVALALYDAPAYGHQIIQSPGQVTIIHEAPRDFQIIRLNEQHPEGLWPTYFGHSIGHFEGDTLVVDTINLNAETTLDTMGLPHTDKLRVTQRIRRIEPEVLEIIFTFDDPGAFSKPWQYRRTYKLWPSDQQILEYICLENQRNSADEKGLAKFGQ